MQLELAEVDLEALALEEDASRGGKDLRGLVHPDAVHRNGQAFPLADAFDPGPLAQRTLDVVLPVRVEELLEVRIVVRPPELLPRVDRRRPAFLPARPPVGAQLGFHREGDGNILPPDRDQVAHAALGELTFDRGHPRTSSAAALGSCPMQQDAGIADVLSAVGPRPPLILDDHPVVTICLLRGDVAHPVAREMEQPVVDREDLPGILVLGVLEPVGEPREILPVEERDDAFLRTGRRLGILGNAGKQKQDEHPWDHAFVSSTKGYGDAGREPTHR
jgi:hypothetical protein